MLVAEKEGRRRRVKAAVGSDLHPGREVKGEHG